MNFILSFRPLLTIVLFVSSSLLLAQDFDLSTLPRVTREGRIDKIIPTPNDKYIIVGFFDFIEGKHKPRVARLISDGTLDEGFTTPFRHDDFIYDAVVSDTGELFVAIQTNEREDKVIKLKSDGSIDTEFVFSANARIYALAFYNGNLLVGGDFTEVNSVPTSKFISVTKNGNFNTVFNNNVSIDKLVYHIGFQGQKIIVSGRFGDFSVRLNADGSNDISFQYDFDDIKSNLSSAIYQFENMIVTDDHIFIYDFFNGLIFLDKDGVFEKYTKKYSSTLISAMAWKNDELYFASGFDDAPDVYKYSTEFDSFDYLGTASGSIDAMAVNNDDELLMGGELKKFRLITTNSISKLDAMDNPIPDFGVKDFYANGIINSLALQGDDKILVGGTFTKINDENIHNLARLNLDGTLDKSFVPVENGVGSVRQLEITADNNVYIVSSLILEGYYNEGLHVLNTDGSYVKTLYPGSVRNFAVLNDQVIIHYFGYAISINLNTEKAENFIKGIGPDQYHTIVTTKNGNVLVSGLFRDPNGYYSTLKSYLPDGTPDPDFNELTVTKAGSNPTLEALPITADGKIWVGGKFDTVNGAPASSDGLIRLNPDGTLDTSFNPSGEGLDSGTLSTINSVQLMNDGSAIIKGRYITTYNNEKVGNSFIVTAEGELSKRSLPINDRGEVLTGVPLDNDRYLFGGYFNLKSEPLRISLGILDLNEPITAVEDTESHLITLYPNPVRDFLTIQVSDQASVYFSIYSLTGQQVAVPAIQSSGDLQVDVRALPSGLYVFKGISKTGSFYRKFVKE